MRTLYPVLLLLGLAAVGSQSARGQGAACDGSRYAADVFPDVTQVTGIVYGQNSVRDYSTGTDTPITLQLDFYEPSGDVATQRPLVIFAFGGSFVSGRRQDLDDLCRAFARKGYATATIDYRLVPPGAGCPAFFPNCNQLAVFSTRARLADQIVRASSDMKAAVRFFRADAATANTYRIDPTRIIVAGYSAGAITALQTAYLDSETEDSNYTDAYQANGGLEGNTDLPAPNNLLPTYNARNLAGALSLAGAVARLSVVGASNPPLYAAHGDADQVVPYGSGTAFGASTYTLYGGGSLHARADSVGLTNQLYTVAGGDHASTRQEPSRTAINTAAAAFFQNIICRAPLPVVLASFSGRPEAGACAATLTWRTASEVNSQAFEIQASIDGRQFATVGTVPSQNRLTGASYTYRTPALAAGVHYVRLRLLDLNGTAAYSPVLPLVAACAATPIMLAPNPARDHVLVSSLPAGPVQLLLYNALGQRVRQQEASGSAELPLAGLPPGMYLLQVLDASGAARSTARLVKE
jgi:acetyl esterase/lipase